MVRLRPRRSNEHENAGLAEEKTTGRGTKRTVLGDVSNKSNVRQNDDDRASKKAKPTKTRRASEEAEQNPSKRRRSSSRLQEKEKAEKAENEQGQEQKQQAKADKPQAAKRTRSKSAGKRQKRTSPRLRANAKKKETVEKIEVKLVKDTILDLSEFKLRRSSKDGFLTQGLAPFDVQNNDNELLATTYITDICQHLYRNESTYSSTPYMHKQEDINGKMRAILIDWLVEVHMKFRLVPETLHLCVNLIDRYCSVKPVKRAHLQLVGVTALLVACKYEEIYPPEVRDCVYITDRAYTRKQVLDMEQDILRTLDFKISVPTAYPFLVRFLHVVKASELTRHAATYYLERTLQEHDILKYAPSTICASAIVLALNNPAIHKKENRSPRSKVVLPGIPNELVEYTQFPRKDILDCAKIIAGHVAQEPITASRRQLIAVKRKFDNKKYLFVAGNIANPEVKDLIEAEKKRVRAEPSEKH